MSKRRYLIAEYCRGPFYMGWHLYLRETTGRQVRNADGAWGWIQWTGIRLKHPAQDVFDALGIDGPIEGGCGDDDAIGRFAFAHRLGRQRIGGKPRGCIEVEVDDYGSASLPAAAMHKLDPHKLLSSICKREEGQQKRSGDTDGN